MKNEIQLTITMDTNNEYVTHLLSLQRMTQTTNILTIQTTQLD